MARLTQAVLVDGVIHASGTERTSELAEKIPARFWDAPAEDEKPPRNRTKAKPE